MSLHSSQRSSTGWGRVPRTAGPITGEVQKDTQLDYRVPLRMAQRAALVFHESCKRGHDDVTRPNVIVVDDQTRRLGPRPSFSRRGSRVAPVLMIAGKE